MNISLATTKVSRVALQRQADESLCLPRKAEKSTTSSPTPLAFPRRQAESHCAPCQERSFVRSDYSVSFALHAAGLGQETYLFLIQFEYLINVLLREYDSNKRNQLLLREMHLEVFFRAPKKL